MTNIKPQIEKLQDVPRVNFWYASILLKLMINRIEELETVDIGLYQEKNEKGSFISFDSDDFEEVQLDIRYFNYEFYIILHEHSESSFASTFKYSIFEDSELYSVIPTKLKEMMEEAP